MPILVPWQLDDDPQAPFPPVDTALREPDGLLAIGGDLSPPRLINAYRAGIFPWFNPGEPTLWWSPDPRTVFDTATFRLSRGNRRALRPLAHCRIRVDHDFAAVIDHCAQTPRTGQRGTWISPAMRDAYCRLHELGHAHCIGVYEEDTLVGGLYGVACGRMFFGESMFSARPGGSKLALAACCRLLHLLDMPLLDAQVHNPHLALLGARSLPRRHFMARIAPLVASPPPLRDWSTAPLDSVRLLLA